MRALNVGTKEIFMRLIKFLRGWRGAYERMIHALQELVEGVSNQSELLNRKFEQLLGEQHNQAVLTERLVAGITNQSNMMSQKYLQMIEGANNQSELMNQKFQQMVEGTINQSELMNQKFQQMVEGTINQSELMSQKFQEMIEGIVNQSELMNQKFQQVIEGQNNYSNLFNRKLNQLFVSDDNQSKLINRKFGELISVVEGGGRPPSDEAEHSPAQNLTEAMQRMPLMIADLTFNTSHPDYDASLVRNYPGKLLNRNAVTTNFAFSELLKQAQGEEVADDSWNKVLAEALVEASSVPGAAQVFERRSFIENYMVELGRRYNAYYVAGWVNLVDALFLYWLVRQVKPNKVLQCGACNGLSSSFMMLALAKNGPAGTLSIIDMPPVFDPTDPDWTEEGTAHGVCIPEGKTTAWMVPDIYRDRLDIWTGDAKDLLPKMVNEIEKIDFFYHDSDHTYRHMMFEFQEAKRKLTKGGVIVADDISWNASLWDFADKFGVPSYNFKGTMGVAFF
jgi:predicted O-methyltransferase YrrM